MDHLMAINEPFHQRDRSRNSNFSSMDSYAVKDTSMRAPGTNDVYVGHIPNEVDSNSLTHFFSQFGEIDRIFEGKKIPPGGMKWAFISYVHPEDSYSNIRPRDRTPALERERERQPPRQHNRERSMSNPMMKSPSRNSNNNNNNGGQFGRGGFTPRSPNEPIANPAWTPYPLLSKTLTVANIPPEFTPKDLYELFCAFGNAEGAFVYAFPDAKGRRVGEVAMTSYLHAQKALEHMDGQYIEGYAVEVSYKPAIPLPQGQYSMSPESNVDYPPPIPMQVCPPRGLWNVSSGGHPYIAPPMPPMPPIPQPRPQPPANYPLWPFTARTPPVVDVVPRVRHSSPPLAPPTPGPVPEPSPPPPYSALPPIAETDHETFSHDDLAVDPSAGKTPCDLCNLFIKNLDDEIIVTQHDLEKLFSQYGTITSAFLATYPPKSPSTQAVSKGFGFVAFSRPQEAQLARDKMQGAIVGRKKIFVSFAEKKEDRQTRLKVLFANMEKMTEDMKNQLAIKEELRSEGKRDVRDNTISRRGVFRGNQDGPTGSPVRPTPQSPLKQSSFQGQHSKYNPRGSPVRGKGTFRRQKPRTSFRKFQPSSSDQTFIDIDFHEDFPPLPKSVKPTQSPTLQKLAQAAAVAKDQPGDTALEFNPPPSLIESPVILSRPQTSGNIPDTVTPMNTPIRHNGMDIDYEPVSHRSSVQGTPANFPRAPPPSSAEMSTAGNTAPSSPTPSYVRPRIILQNLQDRLRAHAIITLQEEGSLTRPQTQSAPVSPLLGPIIPFGKTMIAGESNDTTEVMELLDTTIGPAGAIPSDHALGAEWSGTASLIKT